MARVSPIQRFTPIDPQEHIFTAERWSYLGETGDWIELDKPGKLKELARRLIPKLGTEEFFELF